MSKQKAFLFSGKGVVFFRATNSWRVIIILYVYLWGSEKLFSNYREYLGITEVKFVRGSVESILGFIGEDVLGGLTQWGAHGIPTD